jgi:hypothetical protein
MVKGSLMDSSVFGREKPASERASHRGHGGHRGGLRLDGERLFNGQLGFWARKPKSESIAQRSWRSYGGEFTRLTKDLPRWREQNSRPKPSRPPKSLSPSNLNFSLCDLRDLCVMLSPIRVFPAWNQAGHQRAFHRPTSISSLCDLRDLCAMLSPMRVFLAQTGRLDIEITIAEPPVLVAACSSREAKDQGRPVHAAD